MNNLALTNRLVPPLTLLKSTLFASLLEVLANVGETNESLLGNYDLICHLVTAADGAEDFYSLENNLKAR